MDTETHTEVEVLQKILIKPENHLQIRYGGHLRHGGHFEKNNNKFENNK